MVEEQETPEVETTTTEEVVAETTTTDHSWAPEAFVKDGAVDTGKLRERFDELTAFEASTNERKAMLPSDPAEFEMRVPELTLPEGLSMPKDAEGNDVPFELDENDPELPALRQLGIELELDQEGLDKILHLYAVRELRAAKELEEGAQQEMAKLGPEGKTRITEIERQLNARLPKEMASAITDSISSADALRGLERLMSKASPRATNPAPQRPDMSNLTPLEKLEAASEARRKSA